MSKRTNLEEQLLKKNLNSIKLRKLHSTLLAVEIKQLNLFKFAIQILKECTFLSFVSNIKSFKCMKFSKFNPPLKNVGTNEFYSKIIAI